MLSKLIQSSSRALFFWFLCFFASACATITDRYQFVRVVPEDETSKVIVGNNSLGTGRRIVRIKREAKPKIKIDKQGSVELATRYRWGHSFGGNTLLLVYAPVGWATDLISGAAWEVQDFGRVSGSSTIDETSKVFILPPTMENKLEADDIHKRVVDWVKSSYPMAKLVNNEVSNDKAMLLGYDNEYIFENHDPSDFYELAHTTEATHFIFSQYDEENKSLSIKVYEPYVGKVINEQKIKNVESRHKERIQKNWLISEAFSFLPNTFSVSLIDTTYDDCNTDSNPGLQYCLKPKPSSILSLVSAFGLNNVLHYRKREVWGFYLRFYPDISFSLNHVELARVDATAPEVNADFDWYFMSLGYGPRFSFIVPVGELYFDFVPSAAINYLKWRRDSFSRDDVVSKFGAVIQVGFNTWISDRWNVQFFARSQLQTVPIPKEFLGTQEDEERGLRVSRIGLSLGYYFYRERQQAKKWFGSD